MDDVDVTLTGDTAPPESSPGETEHLDIEIDAGTDPPDDPDSAADDTGDTGDDEAEDDPPERKPVPYDRFKKVNEERKAFAKALEERGLRFDEETQQAVPIAPEDDGLDWDAPEANTQTEQDDPAEFWGMTAEDMAEDPTWRAIAEQLGFDPDEAVRNEWATVKALARSNAEQMASQQAQAQAAEVTARAELSKDLKALRADPEFSASPKAVTFVDGEVKRFKDAGYSASQIKAILPGIQAKAFYENRGDYIQAEAQRIVKGESARTVRMGAQSPESEAGNGDRAAGLTAAQLDMARALKMSASEYAKYMGDD
jgi:hypothetical protein